MTEFGGAMQQTMTKGERDDLIRLIKQRERVAKTAAGQRSAAMLADFENKMSALHDFATNEVWKAAVEAAVDAAKAAAEKIDAEAGKLGIPQEFRPKLDFHWHRRGENEYEKRRAELRRVAKAEIEAIESVAKVQIETESVRAQTEILAHGMTTEAARAFLDSLPAVETLMPALDVQDIQQKLAQRSRARGDDGGLYLID